MEVALEVGGSDFKSLLPYFWVSLFSDEKGNNVWVAFSDSEAGSYFGVYLEMYQHWKPTQHYHSILV